jgi:hypothetical protein
LSLITETYLEGLDAYNEVECFDHTTRKYEVTERDGTTSDGDVRPLRSYVVILIDLSCTCGRTREYHFLCSYYVASARHCNYAYKSRIPREFTVDSLVLTWSPRFEIHCGSRGLLEKAWNKEEDEIQDGHGPGLEGVLVTISNSIFRR